MRLLGYVAVIDFSYHAYCEHVYTDGILINKRLKSPKYWLCKLDDRDTILMTAEEIKAFNSNLLEYDEYVEDPTEYPEFLDGDSLMSIVDSVSSVPNASRFYANKKQLIDKDYERYIDNLNLRNIIDKNPVLFGIVVYRANLRIFPTKDRVSRDDMDLDLDRFQDSALFPGETVAVLMTSKDGQWYFIRNYQLPGWVHKSAIALASRKQVKNYQQAEHFLVVTGDKVFTNHLPSTPYLSNLQLDMGTRLPLYDDPKYNNKSSYIVLFPVRNENGLLNLAKITLPKHKDLSIGYLPFTRANIIKQSFKYLGERYGWGHDFNARDCTGFIGEVYKSFGLFMPRNSKQQGTGTYGVNYRFDESNSIHDKLTIIERMEIGDLIYIPGHVMMFIGNDNGMPYVIHDIKGYHTPDGRYHRQIFNEVIVTQFLPLHMSSNTTYLDKVYNIKRIRTNEPFF